MKVEKPAGPSQSSSAAIGSGDKPEQGPSAPAAVPPSDEQMYELEVPPNTKPGSKLKLTIPGMTEKVVITVPDAEMLQAACIWMKRVCSTFMKTL